MLKIACLDKSAMKNIQDDELRKFEFASLYFMRPSTDWKRDRNDKLDVSFVNFVYESKDLEDSPVYEAFNKEDDCLAEFVADFCEGYELVEADHSDAIKEVIRYAFTRAREAKQARVDMFASYNPSVLDGIEVIKVYPSNDIVENAHKSNYVNKHYGRAKLVI